MKRHAHRGFLLLAAMAAGLLAGRPAAAADGISAARRLPPNVYVFFTAPDVTDLKGKWKQTSLGGLRTEPALADFWRDLDAQLKKASEQMRKELGVTLEEVLDIPSGEVALAYVHPAGKTPGGVAFVEFGKSGPTVEKLLAKAREGLEREGFKRDEKDFEGTRLVTYSKEGEEDAGKPKLQPSHFTRDETLVFATDPALLEEVLARWDGRHEKTFAGNEVYSYIVERTGAGDATPALRWYLNPIELARSIIFAFAPDNPQVALGFGFLPVLGLDKLQAVGGSGYMAVNGYDSISKSVVYIDMPPAGLLNMFRFPPAELQPPKWIPANVSSYFGANWDLARAYEAIESLVDTFRGPGSFAKMMDAAAMAGPMLHPKRDVIDQLTGRMHVLTDMTRAEGPGVTPFLLALGVKDSGKMKDVLAKLAKVEGFPGKSRQFRGETIYEAEIPFGLQRMTAGASVARDSLVLSSDVTLLEQMIRGDADVKTLADLPGYQRIADKFPAKTSMISFARSEAQLRPIYEMIRSGGGQTPGLDLDVEGFDFSKLPEFKVISKYLPVSGGYAAPDKNGAYLESFGLKPDRTGGSE